MPWILAIVAVLAGAAALLWSRRRRVGPAAAIVQLERLHGPARCAAVVPVLRQLAGRDEAAVAAAWDRLEMPLLQALPDCPPPLKPDLLHALDSCAAGVANRQLAKRIMTMRNALLSPGGN